MRRPLCLTFLLAGLVAVLILGFQPSAQAHCEVPCGIYDDAARLAAMGEDQTTIAKAIARINTLVEEGGDALGVNQMVRWVTTKEEHATRIQETIAQYFLAQRVKPVAPGASGHDRYLASLATHHAVMIAAMKCKQSVEPASAEVLHEALHDLHPYYAAADSG